jgi:hypothetical protein
MHISFPSFQQPHRGLSKLGFKRGHPFGLMEPAFKVAAFRPNFTRQRFAFPNSIAALQDGRALSGTASSDLKIACRVLGFLDWWLVGSVVSWRARAEIGGTSACDYSAIVSVNVFCICLAHCLHTAHQPCATLQSLQLRDDRFLQNSR